MYLLYFHPLLRNARLMLKQQKKQDGYFSVKDFVACAHAIGCRNLQAERVYATISTSDRLGHVIG